MKKIPIYLLAAISFFSSHSAFSASFDCTKPNSNIEQMICSDDALSQADDEMSQAYKSALEVEPATEALQKKWLADVRDKCADAKCLTNAYLDQIALLEGTKADAKTEELKAEQARAIEAVASAKKAEDEARHLAAEKEAQTDTAMSPNSSSSSQANDTNDSQIAGGAPSNPVERYFSDEKNRSAFIFWTIVVLSWLATGIFLGITDRAVFFSTGLDALLTGVSLLVLPIGVYFFLNSQGTSSNDSLRVAMIVSGVAAIWTLVNSFIQNKLSVLKFIFVGPSKLVFSYFFIFNFLGFVFGGNSRSTSSRVQRGLSFLALAAFGALLINGDRVKTRETIKKLDKQIEENDREIERLSG